MPDFNDPGPTRGSMIDGMRGGDARKWEQFCELYSDWLRHRALRNLRPEHKDKADDVSQNVILTLLRQRDNQEFTYDPNVARFRAYLSRCIRNEVWAVVYPDRHPPEPVEGEVSEIATDLEPDPPGATATTGQPEAFLGETADYDTEILIKILKGVLIEVRGDGQGANWQCFENRLLRHRPAAEIAERLGIRRDLVYQNVHRILDTIQKLCRSKYQEEFPELVNLTFDPGLMKDVCGDLLADELKAIETARSEAMAYFRQMLRDHLPQIEQEARQASPVLWHAFQSYTRTIADAEAAPQPTPAVERLLRKIDRLFRHRCASDHGDLSHYHHFRLREDNVGIDTDAVARLCGSFEREGSVHDNVRLPD